MNERKMFAYRASFKGCDMFTCTYDIFCRLQVDAVSNSTTDPYR